MHSQLLFKRKIRNYWGDKQPSQWYSKKKYGTREYYEEVEYLRYKKFCPYIKEIAEFDKHKGEKVLEIGVGMGTDLKQYSDNGAECYGIDLTSGAIESTRKHLGIYGLRAQLFVMDAENLEFKDDFFDVVYSMGVLHHTPDTHKAIDESYRVLKPGGKAIIMLYSKSWQHYVRRIFWFGIMHGGLFRMSKQELLNKYSEAYGNSPLTKLYTKKEISSMFGKFKSISIEHYHYKNNFFQLRFMQGNWIIKARKQPD